jgi:hypothetical protein
VVVPGFFTITFNLTAEIRIGQLLIVTFSNKVEIQDRNHPTFFTFYFFQLLIYFKLKLCGF